MKILRWIKAVTKCVLWHPYGKWETGYKIESNGHWTPGGQIRACKDCGRRQYR